MKLDYKFEFSELSTADLNIDAIYKGGSKGNQSDDIFNKLLGLENSGGFRALKSRTEPTMLALVSSTEEPEWPDFLDIETGIFTYYGDNRTPGHTLLDTSKKGNKCLENLFNWNHIGGDKRKKIPPIFIFIKEGKKGRNYRFRGLAVPGNPIFSQTEDLVSVWKSKNGQRFQNYKAIFSVLSVDKISREWITDIQKGNTFSKNCPDVWKKWIDTGNYKILKAIDEKKIKTKEEQMPQDPLGKKLLNLIYEYFSKVKNEYDFEYFAGKIFQMTDPNKVQDFSVTQSSRDGGRDVIGKYKIGTNNSSYKFSYHLEAKRFKPDEKHGIGVKFTSRLISRIKYREFGVFVTTSYIAEQAFEEIIEDNHPIIFITGRDIVEILIKSGINSEKNLKIFLEKNF
tara:strand:+ start:284 stop:1474 length:1191 start_codon:yes stop_codon:yes gene_type:complete